MGFLSKLFGKSTVKNTKATGDFQQLSEEEKLKGVAELITIGAEDGDAKDQYNLGMMFATGKGPYGHGTYTLDFDRAKQWLEKSAAQGNVEARHGLGYVYEQLGDMANALRHYRIAADKNHAPSIISLAMSYSMGDGVEEDAQKAHELFLKAANLDDPFAQYMTGFNLFHGNGVEENIPEAAQWYMKAAAQGEEHAQYEMGMIFEMGGDIEGAKQWYAKAAERGNEKARKKLKEL